MSFFEELDMAGCIHCFIFGCHLAVINAHNAIENATITLRSNLPIMVVNPFTSIYP